MNPTKESLFNLVKQFQTTESSLRKYNGEYIMLEGELTDDERDPEVGRMWHTWFESDDIAVDVYEYELVDVDKRLISEIYFRCSDGCMDNEHILACLAYVNRFGIEQFVNEIDDNNIWYYCPWREFSGCRVICR